MGNGHLRLLAAAMVVTLSILTLALLTAAPAALADGDPASDVLTQSLLFNPIDSGVPALSVARLDATLAAANKAGFPIRVALIASATDLGTVSQLWGKPAGDYAYYLWFELQYDFHGQVLIVMPSGFGLRGPKSGPYAVTSAEAAVKAPTPHAGAGLATSAIAAVTRLAAAAGHPIVSSQVHVADVTEETGNTPWTVWLSVVVGLVLIAGAWTASLRAKPLALHRKATA